MSQISGYRCVFASEIDDELRLLYKANHGLDPAGDITQVDEREIPKHDVLCAGFPCQPFSLAGNKSGYGCHNDGRLIDEVIRIARWHKPAAIILENVPNVLTMNSGALWNHIVSGFGRAGYMLQHQVISPIFHGIPHNRPRMFAVGFKDKQHAIDFHWPSACPDESATLENLLDSQTAGKRLELPKLSQLKRWQILLNHIGRDAMNSSPIMAPEFGATYPEDFSRISLLKIRQYKGAYGSDLSLCRTWGEILEKLPFYVRKDKAVPLWRRPGVKYSRSLHADHAAFLSNWSETLDKAHNSWQILEWRGPAEHANLRQCLIQFRASGIRIMKSDASPSLVAMTPTQIPIIGREMRYISIQEASRLQSLDNLLLMPEDRWKSFKALGNAVNAKIVKLIAQNIYKALKNT